MMRKWLAGVLAAAMCFASVAACAEECVHENAYQSTRWKNEVYESTGDLMYHKVTYDLYKFEYCPDCWTEYDEVLVAAQVENTTNHSWNEEGVCWNCGQVNSCLHDDTRSGFNQTWRDRTQTGDAKTHQVSVDYYAYEICETCNYQLSETYSYTELQAENHNWNDENVCGICGQENTCEHVQTQIEIRDENGRYEDIGDAKEHQYSYDRYNCVICSDCGLEISRDYSSTKSFMDAHRWEESSVCPFCLRVNTCTHNAAESNAAYENHHYESTGDAKYHQYKYDVYNTVECSDCGLELSREYAYTQEYTWEHSWNDENICQPCGQVNSCLHPATEEDTWKNNWRYESTGDARYHVYKYDVYNVEDCSECGLRLSKEYAYTQEYTWEHEWNEDNICTECGQENVCTHNGETHSYTQHENDRYESIGDVKYHQYTYDAYRVVECADCGVELSKTFEKTDGWKTTHSWNSNNVCDICGQENVCTHENIAEYTYTSSDGYAKIDADTHLHTFTVMIQTYCSTCDKKLSEREGGQYEAVRTHNWNSNGFCAQCGAENTCEHTNTREIERTRDQIYTDLGDGLNHSTVEEVRIYTYCDDCELRISDYSEETREYTEEHTSKYRCWKCDFETECPHEGETDQAVDWIDLRYVPLDENRHEVYGRTETHIYCRDCDEELSVTQSEEQELLETWSHDWDDENVCDDCGYENLNPCTHENTDVKLQQTYGSGWIAQNDAMHAETVIYKEVSICADCGKTLGEISALKKVVKTEAHKFYDGECWECGYKNTCLHDGATHTVTEVWEWWDVVCIDDETHQFDAEGAIITYCDLCGDNIAEEKLERQWITKEHEMWIDRCEYCDYRSECAHENTVRKLLPDSDYLYCESISDNAHAATYILHAYDYCEDCDTLLEFENDSDEVGMTKVNEPHNMVSGRCVECGYCEHPVEQIETTYESRGLREYIEHNAYLHKSFIWYDYTSVCKLCGNTVETWSQQSKNLTEEHYYDEQGICRECGFVNECLHENGYRVPLGYDTLRYENIGDENQHQLSEWLASEMFCPDCLMSWDHQTEDEPVVSMEDHRFRVVNGVNVCTWCDYVSDRLPESCQHEHTEKWTYYGERLSGYECIDEDYHAVYGTDLYEAIDCHDCHYTISETLVQEGKVLREANEAHIFDRNGVCRCGYVNPCEHENTVIDATGTDGKYVLQVDDTHHERVSIMKKSVHCADCGIWLSDIEQREERSLYEEHSFNEFGVCGACNYVNGCKHEQTQVNYDYGLKSCYAIDNAQHEITQTIQKREECLTCGEVIGTEFVEEVTEKQNHDGAEACSICGWKTAKHIHAWELPDEQVCSATAIDALTHKIVTQIAGHYRCLECGYDEGQEIVLPAESVIEPHNFTDLGRCADCGYVNFCAHEETYEVQKPVFDPTYQIKDDLEHTYTASMRIETRCVACDQRLSYTATLNAECTEEHVFDNVADLLCDLCGYEKEPPEEASTPEPTPTATPEPTGTPAPTKKPEGGSSGSDSGSGSSGGTKPSKPRETATPTPEELLPKTGDGSLPVSFLLLTMAMSLSGIALLKKRRQH